MSHSVPSYLRLHRDDDAKAALRHQRSSTDQFWDAFSAATGWRIDRKHETEPLQVLPAIERVLMANDPADMHPPVVKENATTLAKVATSMAKEIDQLQSLVRRQEVELAAHATTAFGVTVAESVTESVHDSLQQAIQATGFDSAALYLLDDDTQFLNTRAVVGLPADRLKNQPRPLRGSRADLESMVQDAVLMDDLTGLVGETWNPPEPAGAAVCTALFKGDLPIGTLWLFADQPRELDPAIATIAQLVSSQITLQLSRAAQSRQEQRNRKSLAAVADIAAWQFTALSAGNHLAPGWFVDGMIESPSDWSIGWHAWDVLPDGSLMLAIAEAEQTHAGGAMIAATARAALAAHCNYRHTPLQIMQRINDTLWQTNSAEQLVSLLYARIDPQSGEGEVAVSGNIDGLIAGNYGYRPLIASGGRPLATSMDADCYESTFQLGEGETLLACGAGVMAEGISQKTLGCCLRSAAQSNQNALAVIRREMAAFPVCRERGLVTLSRGSLGN
ncbi:SpoIIE family protein phosphatase [Stieleria sp. TO1_6]|uniref:SpoIIE family protein phosphatase n=1 Tax=Stieleria tagensis TaxID=2956795 RepID=UPI00209A7631|nr:SpoIIE family protein phosphatase [Stieleria tagensis]MCO8121949.1 SpoIIE family protein phosphatase [Stieleria tagensis]